MAVEQRIAISSPQWRALHDRIQVAMELTSRLNTVPFGDVETRNALLAELLGKPLPAGAVVFPPFHATHGLGTQLGEQVSVGQGCSFLDLGGVTIGARTMISPRVTLVTEGHPVEPSERYDTITVAPVVIGENVWVGAAATVLPGVTIGDGSVIGAGTVVAKDVPPRTVVTGQGQVERRRLD
ncbi:sugar O-acetyltransferase [Pedococcus sp. 2YAF34]|uniref:sugar O-acetyltransferase n=1 Tax=Pedococcus sp. 2YAF34 TaxID=3233032 RepID=UPI003F9BF91F